MTPAPRHEPPYPGSDLLAYRVGEAERDVAAMKPHVEKVPVIEERLATLSERVAALTRVGWSIVAALILLTVSVLIAGVGIPQ